MSRILVIEDDASIRMGLVDTLRAKGYAVEASSTGAEGLAAFDRQTPDLVVLDLMLPDVEGFEVCRRIKASASRDVPVIMLTARGAEIDRVRGLEIGADDYVTKPFSLMELLARIGVVLRRAQRWQRQEGGVDEISFGDVYVNFRRHEGRKAGMQLVLSDRAYTILEVFARHRGEVLSREQLLEEAWGYARDLNTRTVDNHIVKIRKAIEDDPNQPRFLITVHGVGYKFAV
ncbi:MAG: response regulator transcription factor [Deltaproteobacteria bacterium]|nr:response regulator transcription factor [Deltaproteobacteria bacterium]